MNSIILSGTISSDLVVQKTKQGTLFCKFTFRSHDEEHSCWFVGKHTPKFVYDVEKGTGLTLHCIVNDRMQIAVQQYKIASQPIRLGQVWDYQHRLLDVTKDIF